MTSISLAFGWPMPRPGIACVDNFRNSISANRRTQAIAAVLPKSPAGNKLP
jgi:hypothetical protein